MVPLKVEGLGLEVTTDEAGAFTLPYLEPGSYTISFTAPGEREIWAQFDVQANQRLDVIVWIQGEVDRWGTESSPFSMTPGAGWSSAAV